MADFIVFFIFRKVLISKSVCDPEFIPVSTLCQYRSRSFPARKVFLYILPVRITYCDYLPDPVVPVIELQSYGSPLLKIRVLPVKARHLIPSTVQEWTSAFASILLPVFKGGTVGKDDPDCCIDCIPA